jgi:hypothetical protein
MNGTTEVTLRNAADRDAPLAALPSMPRALALTSAAGVGLGLAWMLSPLTVVLGGATFWMCARAVSRLDGDERFYTTRILAIAIGARFLIVGVLLLTTRPDREPFVTLFPDAKFLLDRSLWIRNLWLGNPIGPHQSISIFDPYAASSYPSLLAAVQTLAGPSPYGLCLLSVALFTAGALLLHTSVRRAFGGLVAAVGLAAVMVWPTLFAWSVSVLRESAQFFLGAVLASALFGLVRDRRVFTRAAWALALAAALAGLSALRPGTLEIGLAAVVFAAALRAILSRRWIAVAVVIVAAAGLWLREERFLTLVHLAANRHFGHVMSTGQSFRLLDETVYAGGLDAIDRMSFFDCTRFLMNAVGAFVVVPAPWRVSSAGELAMIPQQLAWYLFVAAAVAGTAVGLRRDAWLTCILAGYALAGLVIIAPNSGNVGTLVRHRDMIVPFVLWLGSLGLVSAARAAAPDAPR